MEPGHRGDAGQGLAAKAQGVDLADVAFLADFTGGMGLEAEQGVLPVHAAAVIYDLQQLLPALLGKDAYAPGAGVYGVFDQLFHHRGRALDHLAGGDATGYLG